MLDWRDTGALAASLNRSGATFTSFEAEQPILIE